MELGVKHIKRETFDSSVSFVGELLVEMGHSKARASEIVERFKKHDEIMVSEQFKVRKDDKMFISVSNQANSQLADVLNSETYQSYLDSGVN
jgi:Trk K+ transport system NAD-binding subunit